MVDRVRGWRIMVDGVRGWRIMVDRVRGWRIMVDSVRGCRIRESMIDSLWDQLIPSARIMVSRRGFSRAWKPGYEPVGSGWSRRQSTMD